jgi:hypothetical protein
MGETVDRLKRLAEMHSAGQLSDEEFAAAKSSVLGLSHQSPSAEGELRRIDELRGGGLLSSQEHEAARGQIVNGQPTPKGAGSDKPQFQSWADCVPKRLAGGVQLAPGEYVVAFVQPGGSDRAQLIMLAILFSFTCLMPLLVIFYLLPMYPKDLTYYLTNRRAIRGARQRIKTVRYENISKVDYQGRFDNIVVHDRGGGGLKFNNVGRGGEQFLALLLRARDIGGAMDDLPPCPHPPLLR